MHEERTATTDQDDIGVRIRLHRGKRLRKPFQGNVEGNGSDEVALRVIERLAVGNKHLGLHVGVIVLFPIAVRLRPARLVQELGKLIPAQVRILVIVAAFLNGLDGVFIQIAGIGRVIVTVLVIVRFKGNRATVQPRGALYRTAGIIHHQFRMLQVAIHQPLQVVGRKLHILQDVRELENRVVQHLAGALNRLHLHIATGDEGKKDNPGTQLGRQRAAEGFQNTSHGRISSNVTGAFSEPVFTSMWFAFSTMSGRTRNSRMPES